MFIKTSTVQVDANIGLHRETCSSGALLNTHAPTARPFVRQACSSTLCVPRGLCSAAPSFSAPGHITYRATTCTAAAAAAPPPATASSPAPTQKGSLRSLYPPSTPHTSGYLQVSDLHSIYYEVHGNPQGMPAVVVHGGPGAGCYPNHARFFDPAHYCIILLDQRGCGRSTPTGCLADNTTAALVSDLEALRQHLGVQQWVMLGGSWGVALAVAYAQAYPATVAGLILRGVCLMRPSEIKWMFGGDGGAAALRPLAWAAFVEQLPENERANPVLGYYKRLLSGDSRVRQAAAKSWMSWEMAVGFSNMEHLLIWDGQQWSAQQPPAAAQQQQPRQLLPPPPQPRSAAAAAAASRAAAAAGDRVWQRGVTLPAEFSDSSNSDIGINNSSGGSVHVTVSQLNLASALAAESDGVSCDSAVASGSPGLATLPEPTPAAAVAQDNQQQQQQQKHSWVWGSPAEGYNLQDAEIQNLIQQGLNHRGFSNSAAQALLECHYSLHGAFLLQQPLLDHIDRVQHIPCIAVQGQMDLVCPPTTAVELSNAWPELELRLVPNAGHSMYDPGIMHELVCATDRMRALGSRQQQRSTAATAGRVRRIAGSKNR